MTGLYDEQAEQAVLGCASDWPETIAPIIQAGLQPHHFHHQSHQQIWDAILTLHHEGPGHLDHIALGRQLNQQAQSALASAILSNSGNTRVPAYQGHVETILKHAHYRRVNRAGVTIAAGATDHDDDLIRQGEQALTEPDGHDARQTLTPDDRKNAALDRMDEDSPPTMPLPWGSINRLSLGGLWAGRYVLLGGWSKMGKSVAVDQALELLAYRGKNVALYLTETTERERTERSIARNGQLNYTQVHRFFQQPKASRDPLHTKQIADTITKLPPVACIEAHDWSHTELCRHIAHSGWDACAVDILHDVPLPRGNGLSTVDGYQEIGRSLLQTAKKTRTAMIVAVHLNDNRLVGEYAAKPPVPVSRDIRGCGMLYRQADLVLMVHQHTDSDGELSGEGVLRISDARAGQRGVIDATFNGARQWWLEPSMVASVRAA